MGTTAVREMLRVVEERYQGPRYRFLVARLELRTGLGLAHAETQEFTEQDARRLREAITELCPDVDPLGEP